VRADLENVSLGFVKQNAMSQKSVSRNLTRVRSKDPDELTGNGIGSVIVGDGFFMVAVILSATDSSVSSLLWLSLLIPAFYFFGRGFSDVLYARQIRQKQKQQALSDGPQVAELPPLRTSVFDVFRESVSGKPTAVPSTTERTTRELK
jgi:hypothetical protein